MPITTAYAELSAILLFPYYQTREAYEAATGLKCPPHDPTRADQHWFDPTAPADDETWRTYASALVLKKNNSWPHGQQDANGNPKTKGLILPVQHACSVNIRDGKATGENATEYAEIPPPMRALEPGEYLSWYPNAPDTVIVRNRNFEKPTVGGDSFTAADRADLQFVKAGIKILLEKE